MIYIPNIWKSLNIFGLFLWYFLYLRNFNTKCFLLEAVTTSSESRLLSKTKRSFHLLSVSRISVALRPTNPEKTQLTWRQRECIYIVLRHKIGINLIRLETKYDSYTSCLHWKQRLVWANFYSMHRSVIIALTLKQ